MKKRFSFSPLSHSEVYLLTVLMVVAVVVVPLTTRALFRSQDEDGKESEGLGDFRPVVLEHQQQRRVQRRLYSNAVDRCARDAALATSDAFCAVYSEAVDRCLGERRFGIDYHCPDINDPKLWDAFIDNLHTDEPAHAAAPAEPTLQKESLEPNEKALLRRYRRARVCPESLKQYLPGFYELCISLVAKEEPPAMREGMLNDLATVKMRGAAPEATLKLRQAQWKEFGGLRPDR
ncbi:hypothetical protein HYZ98_02470 [Candidatus Peregrinibacteria bacterium]|nr:hypothetical protein [Candidatus Peregrinibacteria bacterium]